MNVPFIRTVQGEHGTDKISTIWGKTVDNKIMIKFKFNSRKFPKKLTRMKFK